MKTKPELLKELQDLDLKRKAIEEEIAKVPIEPSIIDRVKSIEDVFKIKGVPMSDLEKIVFPESLKEYEKYCKTNLIAAIITEVFNEGWVPDYNNPKEEKHELWFRYNNDRSGFGFSGVVYHYCNANTSVGVRRVFRTRKLAEAAVKLLEKYFVDAISS